MPALVSRVKHRIEFPTELCEPILTIPDPLYGEEGQKLYKCFEDILLRWWEQPLRGVNLTALWTEHLLAHTVWSRSWLHTDPHEAFAPIRLQPPASIYAGFYQIEAVQAVYVQPLPEAYNVFVFLKQDHYNEELMDRLLDRESDILDQYPETIFNFHYLPLLDSTPAPAVPKNATLIFSR